MTNSIAPQRTFEPVSDWQARRARFQHNAVSAVAAPMNLLGSRAPSGAFGILMYHRVTPNPPGRVAPTYNVTPRRFERQLASLIQMGFSCWPLHRALETIADGRTIPPKTFVITFDDGFANNALYALPVLKRLELPATIFLATAYLDSDAPFPFDHWAIGSLGTPRSGTRPTGTTIPPECWIPLNRSQCNELLDSGLITFGAHTHTHADFRLAPAALDQDLMTCCEILEREFGTQRPPFSFPFGDSSLGFADRRFADAARRAGCRCALRIDNQLVHQTDDEFNWPRFDVASNETGWTLAAKLNGWYEDLRRVVRTIRRGGRRVDHGQ